MGKITEMMPLLVVNSIFYRLMAIVSIASFFIFSGSIQAESTTHITRYLAVQNQALPGQKNLLEQIFQVHFSRSVRTIGDALHYLLKPSGYRLVDTHFCQKRHNHCCCNHYLKCIETLDL